MKKQAKQVLKQADKVDAKLDGVISKVPFVGKRVAALTSGGVLLAVVAIAFIYVVSR